MWKATIKLLSSQQGNILNYQLCDYSPHQAVDICRQKAGGEITKIVT